MSLRMLHLAAALTPAMLLTAGCASKKAAVAPVETVQVTPIAAPATEPPAPIEEATHELAELDTDESASRLPPLTFPVVRFEFDSNILTPEGRDALDAFASAWRAHGRSDTLVIAGHADDRGPEEYNLVLGQKRAAAVRTYLSRLGLPEHAIRTVSYGENRPLVQGGGEEAWGINRRAEVEVRD